jgi:hypothetical protein
LSSRAETKSTFLLHSQNLWLGNLRRFGEQLSRLREKGFGDFSIQVGIAPIFVCKRIEDAILPGPILMAYQLIVPGSRCASGCADFKKSSNSFSFPGFASNWAHMETLLIVFPPANLMRNALVPL